MFPLARTCVPALQAERRCEQLVADLTAQLAVQRAQAAVAGLRWPVLWEVSHDWSELLWRAGLWSVAGDEAGGGGEVFHGQLIQPSSCLVRSRASPTNIGNGATASGQRKETATFAAGRLPVLGHDAAKLKQASPAVAALRCADRCNTLVLMDVRNASQSCCARATRAVRDL